MSLTRSLVLGLVAGLAFSCSALAQDTPAPAAEPAAVPGTPGTEPGPSLKVGDAAPALKVAKWFKGTEVKEFEKGKVYVVEFWATWCGPCKKTIPHLTKMAHDLKDKVTVVGVSVWETRPGETGTEYLGKVEKFVAGMGDKMDYNITADTEAGDMAKTWMAASNSQGIPTAFVVDKDSKIVWIGHPMEGLEKVAADVYAGTFSVERSEALKAEAAKAMEARQAAMMNVMQLHESGKTAEALAALDKIAAEEKDEDAKLDLSLQRFMLVCKTDEAGAMKMARELSTGAGKDSLQALYSMASLILENPELKNPDYGLAIDMLTRACEVHRKENDNKDHFAILAPLAKAKFKKGDIDGAIATQEAAIKVLDEMGAEVPAEFKAEFKTTLDEYKAAKK